MLACSPPETEFLVIFQFTAMEMFPTAMAINFGYIPAPVVVVEGLVPGEAINVEPY